MSQPSTSSQPPSTVSGNEEKPEPIEEDSSIIPNPNRWFFDKEKLDQTPSRKKGIDPDKELSYRQQSANFIQDMGQRLQVNQLCINTAIVYMHRFYMYHSFTQFPRNVVSTASIFLAAKVEEQPRKLEHVIKVSNYCLHRETQQAPIDVKSEAYAEQSAELVMNENILLQTLGLDVAIDHPHTHVVKCCQLVRASKDLAQTSYFMATNSLHLTTMCLQYKPTVVACVCIHLACKWSNWEIPRSKEGKDWFWYVDDTVTMEHLETITTEFLTIFNKSPSRLKKKIMSLNQTSAALVLGSFPTHFPMDSMSPSGSGSSMPTFHGKLRSPVQSHSGQPPNKMSRPSSSSAPKLIAPFDGPQSSGPQPAVPKPSIPHGVPPHPLMKQPSSSSSHHSGPSKQSVHSSGKPLFPPSHHGYPAHHMNKDPLNLNKFPSGPPPPHPGRPSHPAHPHQPPVQKKPPPIAGQPRPPPHPPHGHHKGHPPPVPQPHQPPHPTQQHPHPLLHPPPSHQMQPPHLPPQHQQSQQQQQQHQSRDRQPRPPPPRPVPGPPPVQIKREAEERPRTAMPAKIHPNLMGQARGKPLSRYPEIGQSGYGHSVNAFPLLSSEIGVGSSSLTPTASQATVLPTSMVPQSLVQPQVGLGVSSSSPVVFKVEPKTELTSDIAMTLATATEEEEEHRKGKKRKKEKRKHKDKDKEKKPKKDKHKDKHKSKRRSSDSPPLIDTGLTKIKIKLRPPE